MEAAMNKLSGSFSIRATPPVPPMPPTQGVQSPGDLPTSPRPQTADGWIWGENKHSTGHSTTIKIRTMPRFRALKQWSLISLSLCGLVIGAGRRQCALAANVRTGTYCGLLRRLAADRAWWDDPATCLWLSSKLAQTSSWWLDSRVGGREPAPGSSASLALACVRFLHSDGIRNQVLPKLAHLLTEGTAEDWLLFVCFLDLLHSSHFSGRIYGLTTSHSLSS